MSRSQSATLPVLLLPLPKGTVLFPALLQRIPATANRPDIPALISNLYARAVANPGPDGAPRAVNEVHIVCVPIASPYVGPRGQLLLKGGPHAQGPKTEPGAAPEFQPGRSTKNDLYSCGVLAKIIKIEGRGEGEFALHVEGRSRVSIADITQDQLCFEGQATLHPDESKSCEP